MAIEILRLHPEFHLRFANHHHIYTTVTNNPAVISTWIATTTSLHLPHLHNLVVGLDVKCPPSPTPHAATLHLCVGSRCLIIQLAHMAGIPNSLIDFLDNRNYTFVGVNIHSHLIKLQLDYGFGFSTAAVDLPHFAAERFNIEYLRHYKLKRLTRRYMEEVDYTEPPPWVIRSQWDDQQLTYDQIKYASVDAFVLFHIGMRLRAYQRFRF